ncbi:hypothetical protein JHL18_02485 [Clostridium sp. YIM B02505]|uniref:Uncharacterized protein n=1 Tax=Clostridium yunnanense TaxID=2800325 RepID=A0ABS1EJH6_9CLOT|nr:hypothetical protein [Clostridium yunnanense]MBK1809512.1 hypothetical protein [Clostridium yunnanense]
MTTNPGQGADFQKKDNIVNDDSVIKYDESYKYNANVLGSHYKQILEGTSANRIKDMEKVANGLNRNMFIQAEGFPFHSGNLPQKYKKEIVELSKKEGNFINKYITLLKEYCCDKDVVAICATKYHTNEKLNDWIRFQSEIIGMSLENAKHYPLKYSEGGGGSVSCIIDTSNKKMKVISLVTGSNILPAKRLLDVLKDIRL